MKINPSDKTATYSMIDLEEVERSLLEIEHVALESEGVDRLAAIDICNNLKIIRSKLCLQQGPSRHPKFKPEDPNSGGS